MAPSLKKRKKTFLKHSLFSISCFHYTLSSEIIGLLSSLKLLLSPLSSLHFLKSSVIISAAVTSVVFLASSRIQNTPSSPRYCPINNKSSPLVKMYQCTETDRKSVMKTGCGQHDGNFENKTPPQKWGKTTLFHLKF